MYLFDTNIFLEILLGQEKSNKCKKVLEKNSENIYISDFSLHSIGVILFRNEKQSIFKNFSDDMLPTVNIITLPKNLYRNLTKIKKKYGLDFDDAYQFMVASEHNIEIITMDKDFKKIQNDIKVKFI